MDLYNESRTLVYSGTLARRIKSDMGHTWSDLHVALLDNYRQFNLSICREDHSKACSPVNEGRRAQWHGKIPPRIQSKDRYPLNGRT